jgi:hypothetical protein
MYLNLKWHNKIYVQDTKNTLHIFEREDEARDVNPLRKRMLIHHHAFMEAIKCKSIFIHLVRLL